MVTAIRELTPDELDTGEILNQWEYIPQPMTSDQPRLTITHRKVTSPCDPPDAIKQVCLGDQIAHGGILCCPEGAAMFRDVCNNSPLWHRVV